MGESNVRYNAKASTDTITASASKGAPKIPFAVKVSVFKDDDEILHAIGSYTTFEETIDTYRGCVESLDIDDPEFRAEIQRTISQAEDLYAGREGLE